MGERGGRYKTLTTTTHHGIPHEAPASSSLVQISCQSRNSPTLFFVLWRYTMPSRQRSVQSPSQVCSETMSSCSTRTSNTGSTDVNTSAINITQRCWSVQKTLHTTFTHASSQWLVCHCI